MADAKLDYFKKKIIAILKQKENAEETVTPEVKKSLDEIDYVYSLKNPETMGSIEKAYGVGTVRVWKGKKYKKVSQNPTKWVRVFDKVDRGAKSSMTRLINKADSCQTIDELLQFCMSNHAIFKDANGVDLPILDELRKAVKEKQTRLENGDTSSIRPPKKTPVKKEDTPAEIKEEKKGEFSSIEDIQQAVRDGKKVYWKNEDYYVRKLGGLYIVQGKETSAGKIDMFQNDVANFFTKESKTEEPKETEAEKHQNRSDAMKGNQNAYKGGPKEEPKEPETPKTDDIEETKKEMKKVEDLFEKYIESYNSGVGYWLRNRGNADAHHKAFTRATGIPYLVQAKAALEKEGYTMPEIPQKILDKFEEYKKAREGVSGWSTAGESLLSGIRQSEFDNIVAAFKKPLQEKYKELKDKLPKKENGTSENNPPVKGISNKEHAELFKHEKNEDGEYELTYNGKRFGDGKTHSWNNLEKQKELVENAGMNPKNQIEWLKDNFTKNPDEVAYSWSIDSALGKYGEKRLQQIVDAGEMSDEEFYPKLLETTTTIQRDRGYLEESIRSHLYNQRVVEYAKKKLETLNANNSAINDVDLPVDPKDMDEAVNIIGGDVSYITGGGQWSTTTRATLKDKIIRRVRNNPGVARAMLVYIKQEQERTGKTVFTPKNEIWNYLPKLNENAMNALMSGSGETDKSTSGNLYTGDDISSVVEDKEAGRYQVYFTGKPDADTRTILKQNGFRWTPSIGAWQCYNTANGERSLARVAEKLGWNKE